jgi:hypothetical protein
VSVHLECSVDLPGSVPERDEAFMGCVGERRFFRWPSGGRSAGPRRTKPKNFRWPPWPFWVRVIDV